MHLIVFVIASDNLEIYKEHEKCWRSYSKCHPDVTVYFIRQREDISSPYIDGDTIWSIGKEETNRVFEKTVTSLMMIPMQYDYVIRTNLSSVWNFTKLIEFCNTLPKTNVFCGVLGNPGLSGAGMIFSPDVVTKLVKNSDKIERCMWDDIDFGKVANLCNIRSTRGYRHNIHSKEQADEAWNTGYHFYLKDMRTGTRNVENELMVMRYLINKIYPSSIAEV